MCKVLVDHGLRANLASAGHFGKSTRCGRRARSSVLGGPRSFWPSRCAIVHSWPQCRTQSCGTIPIECGGRSIMMDYPKDLDGLRWEKDTLARAGYLIFDRPPMNLITFKARAQIAAIIAAMD